MAINYLKIIYLTTYPNADIFAKLQCGWKSHANGGGRNYSEKNCEKFQKSLIFVLDRRCVSNYDFASIRMSLKVRYSGIFVCPFFEGKVL